MRPNIRVVVSFEELEALINTQTRASKIVHVVGAECENATGLVTLSVLDMSAKSLTYGCYARRVGMVDFDIDPDGVKYCAHCGAKLEV